MRLLWPLLLLWATATASVAQEVQHEPDSMAPAEGYEGLAKALQATLRNHPAIKGQKALVEGRQALLESARAGRYPSVAGVAQALDTGDRYATLRVRQPIWAFGRIDTEIDYAASRQQAEQYGLLKTERDLIEQTAVAYVQVQGFGARVRAARDNLKEHERLLRRIEIRSKGQLASRADVRLARTRMLRARSEYLRLTGELQKARTELLRLTQEPVAVTEDLPDRVIPLPDDATIKARALEESAEIKARMAEVRVAELEIQRERLAEAPTVYLQAERDFPESPNALDRSRAGVVVEGSTEGLGLATRGRAASAQQSYQAALFELEASRVDVMRQFDSLLLNKKTLADLEASQQAAVDAAVATRESMLRLYETGRKSWVDVLNAQRDLNEVRQQLALVKTDHATTQLRIASRLGLLDAVAGIDANALSGDRNMNQGP